jgi:hypothetical protein
VRSTHSRVSTRRGPAGLSWTKSAAGLKTWSNWSLGMGSERLPSLPGCFQSRSMCRGCSSLADWRRASLVLLLLVLADGGHYAASRFALPAGCFARSLSERLSHPHRWYVIGVQAWSIARFQVHHPLSPPLWSRLVEPASCRWTNVVGRRKNVNYQNAQTPERPSSSRFKIEPCKSLESLWGRELPT